MESVYIKSAQSVLVTNHRVLLKDVLTIYTENKKLQNSIGSLHLYTFESKGQLSVSIMKIIQLILDNFPDVDVVNLGEPDFIAIYDPPSQKEKIKERIFTVFLCLIAFFGGGYAIMAYNTDVGAKELFTYLSMLFLGDAEKGTFCLSITYAIGLTIGMIIFFNHWGSRKLTKDPSPLEVQMRLYERDVNTAIIKDMSRRNENMDINS